MNNEKVKGKFYRTIAGCLATSGFWFKIQAPAEILPKAERSYVEDKMFHAQRSVWGKRQCFKTA
ncbi:MAG: hypothetical protein LJE64_00885 [Desulfofustis sp.]|jgi:hypothetical protein|nr:hypothetical protein [Desulfofustis sp.]